MGEIAELVLDGLMCEGCGEWMGDDFLAGHPRRCAACEPEYRASFLSNEKRAAKTIKCTDCGKWFATEKAREQHHRTKHGARK